MESLIEAVDSLRVFHISTVHYRISAPFTKPSGMGYIVEGIACEGNVPVADTSIDSTPLAGAVAVETPQQSVARAGRKLRQRAVYAMFAALLPVLAWSFNLLPILRDDLQSYLAINNEQFGWMFGIGPLLGAVSALFGGIWLDRFGPVRMIRFALGGLAASAVLIACAGPRWNLFLVAVSLSSLFTSALSMAISLHLARLFPRHRRRVLALGLAVGSAGGMLCPLLAETLLWLAHRHGTPLGLELQMVFLIVAGALFVASLCYRSTRGVRPARSRGTVGRGRSVGDGRLLPWPMIALAVLMAMHTSADCTLYLWIPKFLGSRCFVDQSILPGVVLAGHSLSYLISRLLLTLLPERFGRRALLVLPGLAGGGVLILGLVSGNYWMSAGGYVCGAFLWSVEYPTFLATATEQGARYFGRVMALAGVMAAVGTCALIASVGGLMEVLGEPRMGWAMLLPACVFPGVGVGGGLWLLSFDARRRSIASQPQTIAGLPVPPPVVSMNS